MSIQDPNGSGRWHDGLAMLAIRLFLGGLFVWMGSHKIADPVEFLKQIKLYEVLPLTPPHFLNATAIVLPWLEVICGLALIAGWRIRGAAACIAAMLAVFTPAIYLRAWSIHTTDGTPFMQIAFDCGCGGGPVIIWQKLLGNTGLLLLAVAALVWRCRRFTLAGWIANRRTAVLADSRPVASQT
ncbi:MAG: DoxX family protein [Phycisphaerae bacterium]